MELFTTEIVSPAHISKSLKVNSGTSIYFIGDYTDSSLVRSVINEGDMYFNGNIILPDAGNLTSPPDLRHFASVV